MVIDIRASSRLRMRTGVIYRFSFTIDGADRSYTVMLDVSRTRFVVNRTTWQPLHRLGATYGIYVQAADGKSYRMGEVTLRADGVYLKPGARNVKKAPGWLRALMG
jgi:hypothetical protein